MLMHSPTHIYKNVASVPFRIDFRRDFTLKDHDSCTLYIYLQHLCTFTNTGILHSFCCNRCCSCFNNMLNGLLYFFHGKDKGFLIFHPAVGHLSTVLNHFVCSTILQLSVSLFCLLLVGVWIDFTLCVCLVLIAIKASVHLYVDYCLL